MSNTALVTDAAKTAAQDLLQDYSNGVVGHMGGDWSGHLQVNVSTTGYNSGGAAGIIAPNRIRMLLTDGVTDLAIVVPATPVASNTVSILPVIIQQPSSQSVAKGSPVTFKVFAASTTPMSFQWLKNGTAIVGATGSSYFILSAATTDAASYTVVVTNQSGNVTSNAAVLTVT